MQKLYAAIGVLVVVIGLVAFVTFDLMAINRDLRDAGEEEIGFAAYAGRWIAPAVDMVRDDGPDPRDEALRAYMPPAPEGWTIAPLTEADAETMLAGVPEADLAYVRAPFYDNDVSGLRQARQFYQNGDRRIALEMLRYPDSNYKSSGLSVGMKLEELIDNIPAQSFLLVKGMDLREVKLTAPGPLRVFFGTVSMQMQVWVAAPADVTEDEMAALLAGLDVAAMNANVFNPVEGMETGGGVVSAAAVAQEAADAAAASAPPAPAEVRRGSTGGGTITTGGRSGTQNENCRTVNGVRTCQGATP